jgi:hypothetical protein
MPGKLPPRPSFAEWSDNVRSPLVWLKWPDCDESVLVARAADPHTSNLFAVMAAWATDLQVGKGYRVSELITEAGAFVTGARIRPNLWEALSSVAGNTAGHLDPRILSHWLRDHQNRISGGYKLICDTSDKQRPKWQLLEWKSGSG